MSAPAAVIQDLKYALRGLAANPGFAAVAILSLALGIGANTAIFSVVSALLLRPLPYENADRQVILWNTSPGLGITEDWFSTAQYFDIKNGVRSFEEVAIAIGANANLTGDGEPERVGTIRVSSNLLSMLGARPMIGDAFTAQDDVPGRGGKALLAFGTWMRRYGGDAKVVGRTLQINGQPYEVTGVMPPSFSLPREVMPTLGVVEDAEILLPLPLPANAAHIRNREDYNIVATLAPGATIAQTRAELDALTARLRGEHPDFYPPNGGLTFRVLPLKEQVVGSLRLALLVLTASVGFVLLIACANVASLLLSRAMARQKEVAVRAALGASRSRILQQLLTESVLLAIVGGALGLVFSVICLAGIRALGSASVPRLHEIAIDRGVLLFTFVASLSSGVLFGLAPALRLSRLDLRGRSHYMRRSLVVAELALSIMLLVAAGLLIRSFSKLQDVPPGFDPSNVLTLELTMTGRKYNDADAILQTYKAMWERLSALPGVTAAGGVTALPLSRMMAWGPITVEGRAAAEGEKFLNADIRIVGGEYFRAMQIPLLKGRVFSEQDTKTTMRVVVVDEQMATQLWPGEDPIGKRIRTGGFDVTPDTPWMTVVGVVGRVKQDALDADSRMAYYRFQGQTPSRAMNVVVRTARDPAALAQTVTREIHALDPNLPIYKMRSMNDRVSESLAERRFSMLLLALFAALALGLAAIGTYGVMACLVSQGTRELGIRLALGAAPRDLLVMVVRQGMLVALAGLALGVAGALVLTRFMGALLFGVRATDPATFLTMTAALMSVAFAACYIPARRAAQVNPMVSLRIE
ncbi:MAG TPA: ABC transporter permease [Vicinamibacterales bacterium]|jgi:predicted permease